MIYLSVHILIYDYDSTDQSDAQGRIQDLHVRGGAQFSISKVFSCERRKHDAMLGGPGHATPEFFEKQNCATRCIAFVAFWCILGHILVCITLRFLRLFFFIKMLPLQTSLQTKKENYLKCDLMVLKSRDRTFTVLAAKKESPSWT